MFYKIYLFFIIFQLFRYCTSDIVQQRNSHKSKILTDEEVRTLANLQNTTNLVTLMKNIAIERVVGTPGHHKVKKYIRDVLNDLNWHVERHIFEDNTPVFGKLEFENIIGTLNPNADRFLVLACHYDSKYTPNEEFIGATDSAVPCAMMLNLIYVMKPHLEEIREANDVSLKLVFFDGEEAFHKWGPKDSIYGARQLASRLANERYKLKTNSVVTELARWDLLVLLDLLGASDPTFYSYIQSGQKWFLNLVRAETQLSSLNLLTSYSNGKPEQRYFRPRSTSIYIEDDHIPFMQRGVPILHVIPTPFPEFWHTSDDNLSMVDVDTVENLNKIFRIFVAGYLNLDI